jgi:hypothetical protein
MANNLKPHKSLQQGMEEFLEVFHKGCLTTNSADRLELPKSKTDQKSAYIKTPQTTLLP